MTFFSKIILIIAACSFLCPGLAELQLQTSGPFPGLKIFSMPAHGQNMPDPVKPGKKETLKNTPVRQEQPGDEDDSLYHTLKKGGPLMVFIVILGIISMTIIIERIIYFTYNKIWNQKEVIKLLEDISSQSKAQYREDLDDELRQAFNIYSNKMERGLGLLSGIGNLAPIVGFLGTVIGMISAFASIAAATTINAKVVAVGIQVALVTTAGGLSIAAPTLGAFYLLSHIIENRYTLADEIISNLSRGLPRLSDKLEDK